jgi:hypothetical protein
VKEEEKVQEIKNINFKGSFRHCHASQPHFSPYFKKHKIFNCLVYYIDIVSRNKKTSQTPRLNFKVLKFLLPFAAST